MSDDNQDPQVITLDALEQEEEVKKEPLSPEREDEQSVSGSMPDPTSDDDTLKNAQAVDLQAGESTEHPEEIDISRDVNQDEDIIKSH